MTYLEQIERAADEAGVDLVEACRAEGVAITTLQRWRKGEVTPRLATTMQIINRIAMMRDGVAA